MLYCTPHDIVSLPSTHENHYSLGCEQPPGLESLNVQDAPQPIPGLICTHTCIFTHACHLGPYNFVLTFSCFTCGKHNRHTQHVLLAHTYGPCAHPTDALHLPYSCFLTWKPTGLAWWLSGWSTSLVSWKFWVEIPFKAWLSGVHSSSSHCLVGITAM